MHETHEWCMLGAMSDHEPMGPLLGPFDTDPRAHLLRVAGGDVGGARLVARTMLGLALDQIEVGAYDRRIIRLLLAGQESDVLATVASWLHRSRAAGRAEVGDAVTAVVQRYLDAWESGAEPLARDVLRDVLAAVDGGAR